MSVLTPATLTGQPFQDIAAGVQRRCTAASSSSATVNTTASARRGTCVPSRHADGGAG